MAEKQKRVWKWVSLVLGGLVLVGVIVGGVAWWNVEGAKTALEKRGLPDRGVPVMEIKLNGVELSEINGGDKETKYKGNEVAVYDNGEATEFEDVEMKGRGNTTWMQDKKPYQLKFKKSVDLLGLGKAKKWVLLANNIDASLMRNDIALTLAEILEVQYNHRGEFVELYINEEYWGLYYIIQKVEIAKGSVDLRKEDNVLFEIDMVHKEEEEVCYMSYFEECLVLKDAVAKGLKNSEAVAEGFLADYNNVEKAIEEGDYKKVSELLDIDSFAKYFLVNEFAVNPDAYTSSFYLYRNNEGTIAAGPMWDFDLAFANREWVWQVDDRLFSPNESMIKKREAFGHDGLDEDLNISKVFYYLMDMPEFREEVSRLFRERMSGRSNELISIATNKAKEINSAAKANEERWGKEDYMVEFDAMIEWMKERYKHFEEVYGNNNKQTEEAI